LGFESGRDNMSNSSNSNRTCPFLGLQDDADSLLAFPSVWNYCHRSRPIAAVKLKHQGEFCLGGKYRECPVFLSQHTVPLPEHLRAPRSRTNRPRNVSWRSLVIALTIGLVLVVLGWRIMSRWFLPLAFENATPTVTLSATSTPTSTSSPTLTATLVPTTTRTATLPVPFGSVTITRTPTSTRTATRTPTPTPTPTPTLPPTLTTTPTSVTPPRAVTLTSTPARTRTPTSIPSKHQLDIPIGTDYKFVIHRVSGGENMDQYAEKYHTSVDAILAVNYNLKTPMWVDALVIIPVGFTDVSSLPSFETYVVTETGRTAESLAQELGVDPRDLKYYNAIGDGEALLVGDWLLIPRARPSQ
jgi:hypothetical protein